jgi:hypothetical protein
MMGFNDGAVGRRVGRGVPSVDLLPGAVEKGRRPVTVGDHLAVRRSASAGELCTTLLPASPSNLKNPLPSAEPTHNSAGIAAGGRAGPGPAVSARRSTHNKN